MEEIYRECEQGRTIREGKQWVAKYREREGRGGEKGKTERRRRREREIKRERRWRVPKWRESGNGKLAWDFAILSSFPIHCMTLLLPHLA